jgi:predicted component of type VI protein secretion system
MVTLRLIDERDPFRPAASRELDAGEISVGRDATADWRIDDPDRRVSRLHCVFSVDRDGGVTVRDTSSNGVFRETGARLPLGQPMPLAIGEGVRIGNFMIYVDRAVVVPPAYAEGASRATMAPIGQPSVPDGVLIEAFCQGAQIDASAFAGQDPAELLHNLGAIYRETVIGLAQLMNDRSAVRQGVDLEHTSIGAYANNPFKWVSPARVALDLLRGGNDAFMAGADAVSGSFRDLRSHLAALTGAARSAIAMTLATLDPAAIEEEAARSGGLFGSGRTAASWNEFRKLHQSLASSSERDASQALVDALRATPAEPRRTGVDPDRAGRWSDAS